MSDPRETPRMPTAFALPHDVVDVHSGFNQKSPLLHRGPSLRVLQSRLFRTNVSGYHANWHPMSPFRPPAIEYELMLRKHAADKNGGNPAIGEEIQAFTRRRP